jgi:hypothetical protein
VADGAAEALATALVVWVVLRSLWQLEQLNVINPQQAQLMIASARSMLIS